MLKLYPPIFSLKLNLAELVLENEAFEIIRAYSDDFVKNLISNKKE